MKRFSYLMMASLMALGFGACSDDVDVPKGGEEIADAVYMSFDLKLPTSRSETDEDGTTNSDANPDFEVGFETENKVSTVKVVLATKSTATPPTYTYVAESKDGYSVVGKDDTYTVTFQAADLTSILPAEGQTGPQVYAFVVCNPPAGFDAKQIFTGNGSVASGDETLEKSIAQPNSFLMTNAEISQISNIPSDLTSFNSPANPFDLGVVEVERTAARFDYKAAQTNNVYPVKGTNVSIRLTDMALVNMSKNYWWLRRVAAAATSPAGQYDPNTITLCGVETPKNYVVDTDHEEKLAGTASAANFCYHVGTGDAINPIGFTYTSIASLNKDDNWTGANGEDDYKVWRYATENTLPSIEDQIKKYSTGVIFKGVIEETETDDSKKLLDETSAVYVFGDVLYGNWAKVKAAAEELDDNEALKNVSLNAAYKQANATVTGEGVTEPTKAEAVKAGFTVYSPNDEGKYEVYYYYWNRHNDNGNNTQMGVMEFAVVRNNVYKLSVTEINRYGHPGDPGGDPDPEKPDDPDEDDEVYFRVGVKVVPWVVRVNNIQF